MDRKLDDHTNGGDTVTVDQMLENDKKERDSKSQSSSCVRVEQSSASTEPTNNKGTVAEENKNTFTDQSKLKHSISIIETDTKKIESVEPPPSADLQKTSLHSGSGTEEKTKEMNRDQVQNGGAQANIIKQEEEHSESGISDEDTEEEEAVQLTQNEWSEEFQSIFDGIDCNGKFCVHQKMQLPALHPKIVIDGLNNGERLSFPLPSSTAEQLRSVAEKAPFGKGSDTILDENVRRVWQIDAKHIHFQDSKVWEESLHKVVIQCASSLGLSKDQVQRTKASLYKMLLYEKDGHFKMHRDTEKEPGMFGTLIIQLPSYYTGGSFVIKYRKEKKSIDLSRESMDTFWATAFYADCEHKLLPVTKGWRLCLAYNLLLTQDNISGEVSSSKPLPSARAMMSRMRKLQKLTEQWGRLFPNKCKGYIMTHKYTPKNMHFRNLKGHDRQVADFLRSARDKEGNPLLSVCLLLMVKKETGDVEDDGYGRRYDDDDDSDDGPHTMGYVHDTELEKDCWIGPDDVEISSNFNPSFEPTESFPLKKYADDEDIFDNDHDDENYEGYMGNSGPSLEYIYYKGVIVFWPTKMTTGVGVGTHIGFLTSHILSSTQKNYAVSLVEKLVKVLEKGGSNVPRVINGGTMYSYDTQSSLQTNIIKSLFRTEDRTIIQRGLDCYKYFDKEILSCLISLIKNLKTKTDDTESLDIVLESVIRLFERTVLADCGNGASSIFFHFASQNNTVFARHFPICREKFVLGVIQRISKLNPNANSDISSLIGKIAYQCKESVFDSFINATISSASREVVSKIITSLSKNPAALKNPSLIKLAKFQSEKLLEATKNGQPEFSWCQPQANFSGSQALTVNAFLRGNKETETFHGFNGISHAVNWSRKYFGYRMAGSGYSATTQVGGQGGGAWVKLTKTQTSSQRICAQYSSDMNELQQLANLFGSSIVDEKNRSRFANLKRISDEAPSLESRKKQKVKKGEKKESGGTKDDPISLD